MAPVGGLSRRRAVAGARAAHRILYRAARLRAGVRLAAVGLRERHHIGIDRIMWASDYPHSETTWPHSKSLTDEWFTSFGDDDKAKILWKNCAELFSLI